MKKINLLFAFLFVSMAMSATTYKGQVYQGSGSNWTYLDSLNYDENGVIEMQVKVSDDKSTVTLLNWTGVTGDDLVFTVGEDGVVNAINGVSLPDADGYTSTWVTAGGWKNTGYYAGYVYAGYTASGLVQNQVTFNEDGSGEGYFRVKDYNFEGTKAVYYKWSTEEVEEITEATYDLLIVNDSISEKFGPYTALPYNANGEYLTTVSVASDLSYIRINNWDGGSGESLKLYPNAEDGSIDIVNGSKDGCYMYPAIMDGDYYYTYVYAQNYGYIEFDAEDGSEGQGYIYLWQFSLDNNASLYFYWPGELSPIDPEGIEDINANTNAKANITYNIAGQRVNANTKGLVIRNGKKYLNK